MTSAGKIEDLMNEHAQLYMKSCVVQEWVYLNCSFKQQTVMLCALRGCDTASKEDLSKALTRKIRSAVLRNADPKDSLFMREDSKRIRSFLQDLDHYPLHWLTHSLHACEIIGYKCDDDTMRESFKALYINFVEALHLRPESEQQMDVRLADKVEKPTIVGREVGSYSG